MRKTVSLLLLIVLTLGMCVGAAASQSIELYVSPSGNDDNPGTIEQPLRTLNGARARVRAVKNGSAVNVNFMQGEYFAEETATFTAEDSGTDGAPVVYRAYNGADVKFVGYKRLNSNAFEKITDKSVLELMPREGRDNAGVLDLRTAGIKSIHEYNPSRGFQSDNITVNASLYLNGNEQTLAQWPNGRNNYAYITVPYEKRAFAHNEERCKRWTKAKEPMISGYLSFEYSYERLRIKEIDVANKIIDIGDSYNIRENGRWQIFNLIEELDAPGEYYIDRENLLLYYYPPYSIKDADLRLTVFDKPFVTADGLKNVTFENMYFGDTCKSIFEMKNCDTIKLLGCNFENVGTECLMTESCNNILADSCNFYHIGGTALRFNGGDEEKLISSGNKAINCLFYDWGAVKHTYSYCADLSGVGNTVESCIMHDCPHTAIYFKGNDHIIKNNEIYNVVKETADSGAIYAGRSWIMRGTEIENNYFHRLRNNRDNTRYFAAAIYLDDCFSGTTIKNNVIRDADQGFIVGGGRDNFVYGNIIMDSKNIVRLDARGETWMLSATTNNFPYVLRQIPYDKEPWTKYPGLAETLDGELNAPVGNIFSDNLFINNKNELMGAGVAGSFVKFARKFENNYDVKEASEAGAAFVDADNEDFTIAEGSSILKTSPDLAEIRVDKTGIYTNEYRKTIGEELPDFCLITPKNNQTDVLSENVCFSWERCRGADGYILTIAKDKDFKDILLQKDVRDTSYYSDDIASGNKTFYWRVEAYTESRQFKTTKMNYGGPRVLKSAEYSILHKEELSETLKRAQHLSDILKEGSAPGEFAAGSKEKLRAPLENAKKAIEITKGYQEDLDAANKELKDVSDEIAKTVNTGYTNIDYMLESARDWKGEGTIRLNDKTLTHQAPEKLKAISYQKETVPRGTALCFKSNLYTKGGWVAFGLQTDCGSYIYSGERMGYLVVIKPDQIELQRYNNTPSEFLDTVHNSYFSLGETHECRFGVIDAGSAVRVLFYVDGQKVFDVFDTEKPVLDDFYFSVYNGGNKAYLDDNVWTAYLSPAENVPQTEYGIKETGDKAVYADMENILNSFSVGSISGGAVSTSEKTAASTQKTAGNEVIRLSAKMPLSGVRAVSFWQDSEKTPLDGGNGYALVFKNGKKMLVKRSGEKLQYLCILDCGIDFSQNIPVEISAKTAMDGLHISVSAGSEKFECVDSFSIKQGGFLGIYNDSGEELTLESVGM